MTRSRRTLPPDELVRLDHLRHQAASALIETLAAAPEATADILGCVAWYAAIMGISHPATHTLITQARERRWQWREIALAAGLPDNRATIEALALQHRRRTR